MAKAGLASDATLQSVVPTLMKPEEHVSQILRNMSPCWKTHGNAQVRIGRTGEGKVPYHQVFYIDEAGAEQVFGSFDGKNEFQASVDTSGWSTSSSTRDEVMAILGGIRSAKR